MRKAKGHPVGTTATLLVAGGEAPGKTARERVLVDVLGSATV